MDRVPSGDLLHILLQHDQWATRRILDACMKLTPEQFHQQFAMGPGSLHDTMAHIIGATQAWTQTLAGVPRNAQTRIDQNGPQRTPSELMECLDTAMDELAAEAHRLPLSESASRERDGKTYTFTRAAILAHVATHAMHHRAQCLNMLKQLGVKPLPPSGLTEWTRLGEPGDP